MVLDRILILAQTVKCKLAKSNIGPINIRYCPRLFDQVGHQTTYASMGNKLNNVIVRPTKIMKEP